MEIDISRFFNECAPMDYSASVAEIGNNAGAYTWRAACDDSEDYMLLDSDDKRQAFRAHVREFGAWTDAEIAAWTDTELNALFIQLISGDMRECDIGPESSPDEWADYQSRAESGDCPSNIFRADDGRIFYYLGV